MRLLPLIALLWANGAWAAPSDDLAVFQGRFGNLEAALTQNMPDPAQWPAMARAWTNLDTEWKNWGAANGAALGAGDQGALSAVAAKRERCGAILRDFRGRGVELQNRLRVNPELTAYYQALAEPEKEEFVDIFELFLRQVDKRNGMGWWHGDRGNGTIASVNFVRSVWPGGLPLGGEGWGTAYAALEREIPRLEAELRKPDLLPGTRRMYEDLLRRYRIERRRSFGTCGDWAADVTWVLNHTPLRHFEAGSTVWAVGDYQHAATRVRLKRAPGLDTSFILDAWPAEPPAVKLSKQWQAGALLYEFSAYSPD